MREEVEDSDLRKFLSEWVCPMLEVPIPAVGALRHRIWRRRIRGTIAAVLTSAILICGGLMIGISLTAGRSAFTQPPHLATVVTPLTVDWASKSLLLSRG
jgi:hypothetical protein